MAVVALCNYEQVVFNAAQPCGGRSPPTVRFMESSSNFRSRSRYKVERTGVSYAPPSPDSADAAREGLEKYRRTCATRDALVIAAKRSGLSEVEIAQLSGHSRNTVRSILTKHAKSGD